MEFSGAVWAMAVQTALGAMLVSALMRAGWRTSARRPAVALGWLALAVGVWMLPPRACGTGLTLPGCGWQFVRPPSGAGPVAVWIGTAVLFLALPVGLSAAALTAIARFVWDLDGLLGRGDDA